MRHSFILHLWKTVLVRHANKTICSVCWRYNLMKRNIKYFTGDLSILYVSSTRINLFSCYTWIATIRLLIIDFFVSIGKEHAKFQRRIAKRLRQKEYLRKHRSSHCYCYGPSCSASRIHTYVHTIHIHTVDGPWFSVGFFAINKHILFLLKSSIKSLTIVRHVIFSKFVLIEQFNIKH